VSIFFINKNEDKYITGSNRNKTLYQSNLNISPKRKIVQIKTGIMINIIFFHAEIDDE
jgi:hypothetical protein